MLQETTFALGVMATFLWFMTVPAEHRTNVTRNIGMTVLNMAWIPLLGGYLIATLKLDDGKALVFAIILLTFLFDTAAFLIGSVSGGGWFQRPLAPNVSPKKSWEGLLGGTFATVVASGAFVTSFVLVSLFVQWMRFEYLPRLLNEPMNRLTIAGVSYKFYGMLLLGGVLAGALLEERAPLELPRWLPLAAWQRQAPRARS